MVLLTAELQAEARAKGSRKLSSEQMAFDNSRQDLSIVRAKTDL
jgi:hypothetical protein